jgi:hypothetical protein
MVARVKPNKHKYYKIYAGLKGKFGGPTFQAIDEFESEEEALNVAKGIANEIYYEVMGSYDTLSYKEVYDKAAEQLGKDADREDLEECIDLIIDSEKEKFIDYYVKQTRTPVEEGPKKRGRPKRGEVRG